MRLFDEEIKALTPVDMAFVLQEREELGTFKVCDNTLDSSASYMRDHYSFNDLMAHLKGVRINKMDKTWMLTKITKKTTQMCKSRGMVLPSRV